MLEQLYIVALYEAMYPEFSGENAMYRMVRKQQRFYFYLMLDEKILRTTLNLN